MASGSRKRPLPQGSESENEPVTRVYGRRQRNPTQRQQQIDEYETAKLQATIDRQKKKLAKQRQRIVKYQNDEDPHEEESDDMESQDEGDIGHGARAGGGFTSVISSKGTVPHTRSVAQKKPLVLETDLFVDERETLEAGDMNLLDLDEDMFPLSLRLPSRSPISPSPPPSAHAHHEHTVNRREHTTPPPSPRARIEHTTRTSSRIHHTRTTPSSRRMTPTLPRLDMNRDSLPPNPVRLPQAPFREGYTPGPKPKAADYEDRVEKMLLNAMHEYACLILTVDAFPNEVKQTQWAEAAWRAACDEVGVHYECSVRMIRLVTGRGSWARGFLKDAARNNFKIFKFKEGSTEEIKIYNQERRLSLLRDDAFHHKNWEAVTGFGEHPVVIDILRDAVFEDSKSYGVKYSRYFNPISVNLLALVFTMIEFLINEWSTGERRKSTFRSTTYSETFETHRLRTEQWCDLEPTVTTNIRKRMFRTLMKKAGALEQVDGESSGRGATGMTPSMKERAREALAGRTGETDDEDE